MALERITHTDWVRVDDDGMTLRFADLRDAEELANVLRGTGDAGWVDVSSAIFDAEQKHRLSRVYL